MKRNVFVLLALSLSAISIANAQPVQVEVLTASGPNGSAAPNPESERPVFDIFGLIDRLADEMNREFIVDPRLNARMVGWSTAGADADYDTLQALLRSVGFVALEFGDQIRIVSDASARSEPSRMLQEDDRRVSDHEVVTRVIDVTGVEFLGNVPDGESGALAPQLVPALRPMMSAQAAQLTSVPGTSKLILVDRYDNIRRITAVIDELRR